MIKQYIMSILSNTHIGKNSYYCFSKSLRDGIQFATSHAGDRIEKIESNGKRVRVIIGLGYGRGCVDIARDVMFYLKKRHDECIEDLYAFINGYDILIDPKDGSGRMEEIDFYLHGRSVQIIIPAKFAECFDEYINK